MKDLQSLLSNGGLHIVKWTSKIREFVNSLQVSERAKEVKDLDLDYDVLPTDTWYTWS